MKKNILAVFINIVLQYIECVKCQKKQKLFISFSKINKKLY